MSTRKAFKLYLPTYLYKYIYYIPLIICNNYLFPKIKSANFIPLILDREVFSTVFVFVFLLHRSVDHTERREPISPFSEHQEP